MSATYWVLASDELITSMDPSLLPDGLRLTDPVSVQVHPGHGSWYLFEDDGAPPELEGKQVELILGRRGREGAKAIIIERRVLPLWTTSAGTWAACCTGCSGRPPSWSSPWPCSARSSWQASCDCSRGDRDHPDLAAP